ncbi:hypothetical protein [Runella sp. SP2]|uniref:hypothetical protein n=1 Tax=Runella sp. SP2 TaxID=2268026 RepID=UPI000F08606B|nr:hypothetical protein [Runella sp. SP2]AYQ31352.1 hypothetical protein DTQ70_03800 [Runella sp. SP2]
MTAWFKQSDTNYAFVGLSEEARLDGVPKLLEVPIGHVELNPNTNQWDAYLNNIFLVSFPQLLNSFLAVEECFQNQPL